MSLRHLTIIFILTFTFSLYGQVKVNDTLFIVRDSLYGSAQSIYFDNNKHNVIYDELADFTFGKYDVESYDFSLNHLRERKLPLKSEKSIVPIAKWVVLRPYKGHFYAYAPADYYSHYKVAITDSAFIEWGGEGPIANKVLKQWKVDDRTYRLKLTGAHYKSQLLTIHVIDNNMNIAVFEYENSKKKRNYLLMVAANKIRALPLIVSKITHHRQAELDFDKLDFVKLIREAKAPLVFKEE